MWCNFCKQRTHLRNNGDYMPYMGQTGQHEITVYKTRTTLQIRNFGAKSWQIKVAFRISKKFTDLGKWKYIYKMLVIKIIYQIYFFIIPLPHFTIEGRGRYSNQENISYFHYINCVQNRENGGGWGDKIYV